MIITFGFLSAEDAIDAAKNKMARNPMQRLQQEDRRASLEDIHLSIPRGQLVGICGAVGSGKSTLLLGVLGQLEVGLVLSRHMK